MKLNSIALTLATAGLVAAQPHAHGHRHPHRRTVDTSGTVVEYELNGQRISADDVCKGIADGTLLWAAGVAPPDACQSSSSSATPSSTPTPTPTPTPSVAPAEFIQTSSSSTPTPSTPTPSSSSTQAAASTPAASSSSSSSSSATGIDVEFPDGEIDCSTFPSEYGPVSLEYHGLGGWTGVQVGTIEGTVINLVKSLLTGEGNTCTEGSFCSYACPAGYQKSQWPKEQGSKDESVGGLHCRGGKLYLTNPSLSKNLCIEGVGGVYVQNKVGEQVAVCRTDYPGTEAETVPLALTDDTVQPLTCPNGATYYEWTGKDTSAQYYVNPKGTSIEEGCKWGDKSKPVGNFAPMNMGASDNNGKWLSLFQNTPTTDAKLDFCAEIKGDHLSGTCRYEKGSYITETETNDSGCTVEVMSGDATIVFTAC